MLINSYPYRLRDEFALGGAGGRRGPVWANGPWGVRGGEQGETPVLPLTIRQGDLRQPWRSPQHSQGHIGARCKQTRDTNKNL